MRIEKLDIYGYGKWIDTSFTIADDVQVFYGQNEAGKSTLMSFIHSILFGFPTRNSTLLRYEPRESSRYGGRIIAQDLRFGEVIIERIHQGKVTGDVTVTLEDGTTGADELLDSLLYGMDRNMFESIFSFSLTDIENVHQLNQNQLSRYLLNVGAHGSDRYLRLADEFYKESESLFKPSGRVPALNQQIAKLEEKEAKLIQLEAKNEQYQGYIEALHIKNNEIEVLEARQEKAKMALEKLNELKKEWHTLAEIKELEKKISEINLPPLKEDGRYLLEEYNKEMAQLTQKVAANEQKLAHLKNSVKNIELLENIAENKDKISALENDLPEIVERLNAYENINEKRGAHQRLLTTLEQKLNISDLPDYPTKIPESKQQQAYQWLASSKNLTVQKEKLLIESNQYENEINTKNQQVDQWETVMWDDNRMLKFEHDISKQEASGGQGGRLLGNTLWLIGSGLLGIILIISAMMLDLDNSLLVGLIGLLTLLLSAFGIWRDKKDHQQQTGTGSDLMKEEFEKQQYLKKNYNETLAEIDVIQAHFHNVQERLAKITNQEQGLLGDWENLLGTHNLPKHLPLIEAPQIFEDLTQLHDVLQEDGDLATEQADLRDYLRGKISQISEVLELNENQSMTEQIRQFRTYLIHVKTEQKQAEDTIASLNELQRQLKDKEMQLENAHQKVANLLEAVGVENEEAYLKLYDANDQLKKDQSRLAFLQENIPDYKETDELPTRIALAEKLHKQNQRITENEAKHKEALVELANIQITIQNIEEDGTYSEKLQEFENEKAVAQHLTDEWIAAKLAAGLIKKTLDSVTEDRFNEMILEAEEYFSILTNDTYEQIIFKKGKLFVQHHQGNLVDVEELSRGTAEPLYVAIRLAYIKNTQDIMELPIIIDDPFVNFDPQRVENIYRLLQKLSRDLQIIYFSFDPRSLEYFGENQIKRL